MRNYLNLWENWVDEVNNSEIKYSSDIVSENESRRYYIKSPNGGYSLFHHTLIKAKKYRFITSTIDGELAERWLSGEIVIARIDKDD